MYKEPSKAAIERLIKKQRERIEMLEGVILASTGLLNGGRYTEAKTMINRIAEQIEKDRKGR